jgi:hypothetical protein
MHEPPQSPVGKRPTLPEPIQSDRIELAVNMAGEGDEIILDGPVPNAATDSNGLASGNSEANGNTEPLGDKKRVRSGSQDVEMADSPVKRQKGVAPVKAEYVPPLTMICQPLKSTGTSYIEMTTRQKSRMRLWMTMQQKPQMLATKQVIHATIARARTTKKTRSKKVRTRVEPSAVRTTNCHFAALERCTTSSHLLSVSLVTSASSNTIFAGT